MSKAMTAVRDEKRRQDSWYPDQHLPDGTDAKWLGHASKMVAASEALAANSELTWAAVVTSHFFGVMAEPQEKWLRMQLVRLAASALRWIEDIDSRTGQKVPQNSPEKVDHGSD